MAKKITTCWRCRQQAFYAGWQRTKRKERGFGYSASGYCFACKRMSSPYAGEFHADDRRHALLEARFRELLWMLDYDAVRRDLLAETVWPCTFLKTADNRKKDRAALEHAHLSTKAQTAICLYCRQDIASWKGRPNRKTTAIMPPPELVYAIRAHVFPCSLNWAWGEIAQWSTREDTSPPEPLAVARHYERCAWLNRCALAARDRLLVNGREPSPEQVIAAMPSRAPMKRSDPRVVDLEVGLHQIARQFPWPEYTPFEHGDDAHPHRFRPITIAPDEDLELEVTIDSPKPTVTVLSKDLIAFDEIPFEERLRVRTFGRCGCGIAGPVGREAVSVPIFSYAR